jgi:hypothetical protein
MGAPLVGVQADDVVFVSVDVVTELERITFAA